MQGRVYTSDVTSPKFLGSKSFGFKRAIFCLGHRLAKHKMTRYARNLGCHEPFVPWLRLWYVL